MAGIARRHMTTPVRFAAPGAPGPFGPTPGAQVTVRCWPEESVKQVRAADGRDVVSSTRLWCEATRRNRLTAVVGATVTYGARTSEVVAVVVHDPGAIRTPALLEVTLL